LLTYHKITFSDTLFIGRELRSTATLSPCGPGKRDTILNSTRMGLQPCATGLVYTSPRQERRN